jgi:S-DNA-T family DNA segregation ATPase FtsK/SpoIIIE
MSWELGVESWELKGAASRIVFQLSTPHSQLSTPNCIHMERLHLWRRWIPAAVAVGGWLFLLLSVASFHATDWPSHAVYPYPPTANLCGTAGAVVAYGLFLLVGQGAFPILLFSGLCVVLFVAQNRVSDPWMRTVGLILLAVAFAASVHQFQPGTDNGLPEGQGGILGIGAATFLQAHFSTAGTHLVLGTALLVGLLLAADDLVVKGPTYLLAAFTHVRDNRPSVNVPNLGNLSKLARDAASKVQQSSPIQRLVKPDEDPEEMRPPVRLSLWPRRNRDDVDLTYDNDEPAPAVVQPAHVDVADPAPAVAAVIPPPPPPTAIVFNAKPAAPSPPPAVKVTAVPSNTIVVPIEGFNDPIADAPEPSIGDVSPAPTAAAVGATQRPDIVVKLPSALKPRQTAPPPPKELGEYTLPGWDMLAEPERGYAESQEAFVREKAAVLEQALREFNVDAHVVEIDTGPVITMYELALAPGLKVSTITSLTNDIMRSLKAESIRIVAPVPGKNTVGIEVPNAQKEKVRFKELLQLAPEAMSKMTMPLFLGKDASGEPLITDLVAMPHCLIAGTTGSGKSVCINTIIMSVMYLQRPDRVKFILIDPKVVEMAPFKDIPHLMCPVINDTGRACSVLEWACEKMDERYEFLAEAGVRNIKDYNKLTQEELNERFLPSSPEEEAKIPKNMFYIVIIIDELADLMMTSGKEVESFIVRLAQKSRAVGIHLILATQRPAATVVTGLIKSNMPTRISFRVQSRMDSRIVMDQNGAELLLGQGDMLFMPPGASKPVRSQGTFIDDKEIRDSVKLVKGLADAQYEPELVQIKGNVTMDGEMEKDELFDDAVRVVLETKRGSVSLLQRRLTIGYARASRLIEMMAQTGIVGDYKGSQAREAMLTLEDWDAMKAQQAADAESGMTV